MKKSKYNLIAACTAFVSLFSLQGHAGMVVSGTRFVLTESDHAKGITVKNTGKEGFLVKSQIILDDGHEISGTVTDKPASAALSDNPFVITPPLFLLGAGKSSQLRLECISCHDLPHDRESLYRLGISAIPGGKQATNTVQLAVRSTFKLFYRPSGLPGEAGQAYQELQWQRHGKDVIVRNPTPYYVTLFNLNINNKEAGRSGMIAPYSTRTQSWCPVSGDCHIQWASLNDFGGITPLWSIFPGDTAKTGKAATK
ncbi:molecular chaperone [Klebsiella aerogenes]|uniref:fimbrial biogenesis chaperone n=1 Tax=Klebsiella aerogenes TaxID=548 RepID=UPI0023BA1397|nr:molecular chaperone [Klebsiella aerogenes]MDF0548015.1 molecular chaperone [Klebsiella aerogenes]